MTCSRVVLAYIPQFKLYSLYKASSLALPRSKESRSQLPRWQQILCLLLLSFAAVLSHAKSFDCDGNRCNLPSSGTYPNLVVGEVIDVANDEQALAVFRWAKAHSYFPTLPNDEAAFLKYVQVMSVAVPDAETAGEFTLLMSREEYMTSAILPGDFVRYTPHQIDEPRSPTFETKKARIYWDLFGCIAVLCRADDTSCPNRYSPGIYRVTDGTALNPDTEKPIQPLKQIDPTTYFPL